MKVVTRLTPAAVVVVGSDSTGFPAGSVVNKYAIIGAGTGFLGLGFLLLIILCACQKNTHRRRRPPPHLVQVCVSPAVLVAFAFGRGSRGEMTRSCQLWSYLICLCVCQRLQGR